MVRSSGGFLGLIITYGVMLLRQTPSFEAASFFYQEGYHDTDGGGVGRDKTDSSYWRNLSLLVSAQGKVWV